MTKFDVNLSILFTELPLHERPGAARSAGFDAVELWWPFAVAVPGDREVDALVRAIQDAGVALVGLNFFAGDMPGGDRGLVSWPDRAAEFRDNVEVTVGIGERLGCRAFNALYGNRVEGADPAAQDDLAVLGVAHDAHQAVELAATHEPMVLLLDAHMPGSDLASTLRAVKAASPSSKVLMLSADTRKETIAEALRAGADGFLAKDASSRQVAGAIRSLVEGRTGLVITAEPVARPTRDPSVDLRVRTLSVREREILGLLANGWSNRRIADECFLSLNTVRTHVQNVLVKLGVHSKLEAVAFALEHQVVGNRAQASWVAGRA